MQQRRLRPGDVLDDYCPRERRITDHAIVAMIDDNIKQTRCVSCDTEHEYKQAKVPAQRRKKPALFTQVLDGLQAPTRRPHLPDIPDDDADVISDEETEAAELDEAAAVAASATAPPAVAAGASDGDADRAVAAASAPAPEPGDTLPQEDRLEGPVRRQLIRAALPRPEGQPPPTRVMPEFTVRQPNMNGRSHRHGHGAGGGGGRRRGQHQGQIGPMRFGRDAHGQRSNGNGQGRQGGHAGPHASRSRHGGKKGR